MRIRLLKHNRVGARVRRPGEVVDIDDATAQDRISRGVAEDVETGSPGPPPVAEAAPDGESDEERASEEPEKDPKMPAKVAKLEAWQAYAKTQGVDPKGMKREEIIARFI